ncbi:MAG: hypothetical protein KDI46_00780 [Alphaproteobacteria bacterium]|nr:hypothetical protein [Alphaproteobacteria bacterium]
MPVTEQNFRAALDAELVRLNDGGLDDIWQCLALANHFNIQQLPLEFEIGVSRKAVGRVCEYLGIPNDGKQSLGNRVYDAAVQLG